MFDELAERRVRTWQGMVVGGAIFWVCWRCSERERLVVVAVSRLLAAPVVGLVFVLAVCAVGSGTTTAFCGRSGLCGRPCTFFLSVKRSDLAVEDLEVSEEIVLVLLPIGLKEETSWLRNKRASVGHALLRSQLGPAPPSSVGNTVKYDYYYIISCCNTHTTRCAINHNLLDVVRSCK